MDPEDRRRIAQRGGQASHGGRSYEEDYDERDNNRGYEEEEDDYGQPSSRYQEFDDDYDTDEDYDEYDEDEDFNQPYSRYEEEEEYDYKTAVVPATAMRMTMVTARGRDATGTRRAEMKTGWAAAMAIGVVPGTKEAAVAPAPAEEDSPPWTATR